MEIKFCIDKQVKGKAYPNLATHKATPYTQKWRQFSVNSPFSEPVMLLEHLIEHDIDYSIVSIEEADNNTLYPIALSFFDFSIMWFDIMPKKLISKLKDKSIKILFYYSEGDNPYNINKHLTQQCIDSDIPREQILFVSANSEARNIDHFFHVTDDELLFRFRNSKIPAVNYSEHIRNKKYTALVRMHKFWRANVMSTIWQQRLDTDGYFAYGNSVDSGEKESDNPIEVDKFFGLRQRTKLFLTTTPYRADLLDNNEHNNHTTSVPEHFNDSYINIVLESHMDVDQSNGVLLTEKTFKPIKNAQPFIIFGAHKSLHALKELGYKTFDDVISTKYDDIKDTTERWNTAMNLTTTLLERSNKDLRVLYIACKDDLIHNQELFLSNKSNRLNKLLKDILND
jgi:hypothetical protein